jgi:hypothetical protein
MSQKLRIVQHLCPQRHCITALAYESESGEPDPVMVELVQHMEAEAKINPWCGICKSRNLFFEDEPTRFRTKAEAEPFLREVEEAQAATRRFLDASKG